MSEDDCPGVVRLDAKKDKTTDENFEKYLKSKYNAKINTGTIGAAVHKFSTYRTNFGEHLKRMRVQGSAGKFE